MLAAALILAGATIDYQTVAQPLAEVLKELSAISGVEMRASEAVESDKLVIRVEDVQIETLRNKIAVAIAGRWEAKDGAFILHRDLALQDKRYTSEVERRTALLRDQSDKFVASIADYRGQNIESLTKNYYNTMHVHHFVGKVIERIDLGAVAALSRDRKIVSSTHPTRMQLRLPDLSQVTNEAIKEHNRIADLAAAVEADEPPVGSMAYRARRNLLRKWAGPLRVVAIAKVVGVPQVMVWFVDNDGTVVGSGSPMLGSLDEKPLPKLPEGSDPRAEIKLSRIGQFTAGTISGSQASGTKVELTDEELAILSKPTEHDPLSFHVSELLLGIAKHTNWQLVASVRDEMTTFTDTNTFTVQSALDAFLGQSATWHTLSDNWLLLGPTQFGNPLQIDRVALETLIKTAQRREPGIADYAEYASRAPTPWTAYLSLCYQPFGLNFAYNDSDWLWLRFYQSLSEVHKRLAHTGGTLRVADLSQASVAILTEIAFFSSSAAYLDTSNSPMMAELSQDLKLEPTESMPNGLPPSTVLQFTPKSQIAVETVGIHPAARNPRYSISTLAYFATADPRAFGDSGPPQIGEFIVGRLNSIDISLQIRSDMRLFATLREYTFDKKSEKYSLYSAPADFQKAYKEALDRRKGGG